MPCCPQQYLTVSQSQEKRPRTQRQMFLCHHRAIISSCLYQQSDVSAIAEQHCSWEEECSENVWARSKGLNQQPEHNP